ncbi:MAG: hypothetical protein ACRYGG_16955, partial [Janthinobacterium lividum]
LWELGYTPSGFDGSVLPANGAWISAASLQSYNTILLTVTHDRGDDLIMPSNAGGYGDGGDYGCFTVYDSSTSTTYPASSMTRVSATQFSVGINGAQQINVQFTPYGTSTSITAATTFTVPYPTPTSGTTQIGPTSATSPVNPSTNLPYYTITPMLINGVVTFDVVKSTGSSTETPSVFLNGNYIGHVTDSQPDGSRTFVASQTVMPAVPASGTTIHFCDKNGYYLPGGLPTDNFHLKTLPTATSAIKAKWIAQGLPIQSTDAPIKLGAVGATTTVTATTENTPVGNLWVSNGSGGSVAAGTLAITPATPALTFSTTGILTQATSGATISVPYTLTCTTNAQLYFAVMEQDGHTVRTAYAAAPAPTGSGPYTTSLTASMALTGDYVQVSTSSTGSPIIGNSQPVTIVVSSSTAPALLSVTSPGTLTTSSAGTVVDASITIVTTNTTTPSYQIISNAGAGDRTAVIAYTPNSSGSFTASMPFTASGDYVAVYSDAAGSNLLGQSSAVTITTASATVTPSIAVTYATALTQTATGASTTTTATFTTTGAGPFYYYTVGASPNYTAETGVQTFTPASAAAGTTTTQTITFVATGDFVKAGTDSSFSNTAYGPAVTLTVASSTTVTPTLVSVTAPGSLTQSAAGVAVSVPTTFVTTGLTQFYWSVFGSAANNYALRSGPNLLTTTGTATASVPYSYTGDFLKITTDSAASNAIGYGSAATLTVATATTTTTTASLPTTLTLTPFSNATGQDFTTTTAFNTAIWTNVYGTGFTFTGTSDGLKITSSSTTSPAWQQSGFMQLYTGASGGFGYGLFTFRARAGQSIQGPGVNLVLWNADGSWLSSGNVGVTGKGTYSEVDPLESINGTATVQGTGFSTVHYYDSTQANNHGQESVALVNSSATAINLNTMHDYALYWADGIMALYVDETLLWQRTGERVPKDYAHGGCNKTLGAQVVVPSGTTEVATSVVLNIANMYHYTGSLTTGTTATAGLPAIALPTYAFRPNFDAIGQNPQFEYYWKGENDVANQVGLAVLNDGGSDNYRNQTAWLR